MGQAKNRGTYEERKSNFIGIKSNHLHYEPIVNYVVETKNKWEKLRERIKLEKQKAEELKAREEKKPYRDLSDL